MAWLKRDGENVNATQFGMGMGSVPGQRQEWDKDGCYYITTLAGGRKVRLSPGDWVCCNEDGAVVDVQSNGKFVTEHIHDPSVQAVDEAPAAPSPVIAMTTADLEAEREKLIKDSIIDRPHEPEVVPVFAKRGPGRPKGAKNKPKAIEPLEEL